MVPIKNVLKTLKMRKFVTFRLKFGILEKKNLQKPGGTALGDCCIIINDFGFIIV